MSLVSRLLMAINNFVRKPKSIVEPTTEKPTFYIPTVRFDSSRVTKTVKAELKQNIKLIKEFNKTHYEQVYGNGYGR
jgi:hypothetical protein